MKYKVTMKSVKDRFAYVISVQYCALQTMLELCSPQEYTCGNDGWHADIYHFGNTAIVTGYQPFGNCKPQYEVVHKYEEEAERIRRKNGYDYIRNKNDLDDLIHRFISEVTGR